MRNDLIVIASIIILFLVTEGTEYVSVQDTRLIDVFALGPFMIWFGMQSSGPAWSKYVLIAAGTMTMTYNWKRYKENAKT